MPPGTGWDGVTPSPASDAKSGSWRSHGARSPIRLGVSPVRPRREAAPGVHAQGDSAGSLLRHPVRRGDGLSGPASRPDGIRVRPDRRARHRRLQEDRQVHDPREQHRADDRLRRGVRGGRGRLHDARAALPLRRRGVFQVPPDLDPGDLRRLPRRALHDSPAPRPDRQGARQPSVPGGHRLRGRADRGGEGRQPRQDGLRGSGRLAPLQVPLRHPRAVERDADLVPHEEGERRPIRPRRWTSRSRRSTWGSGTSSARASPPSSSREACSPGWR